MMKKHIPVFAHLLIWASGISLVFVHDSLTISYFDYREFAFFSIITGTLINAVIFYINGLVLLPARLDKHMGFFKYIIFCVLLVGMLTLVEGFADFLFNRYTNPFWDNKTVQLSTEYFDLTLLVNTLFLVFSFGYGFAQQWFKNEVVKRQLMQDNIQTELALLKSQINPHFLFNTLNNIFGLARKSKNQVVAQSIAKLADMMRYVTYETKEGRKSLEKEIEYIKSYIELQKLRFSEDDDIVIDLDIKEVSKDVYIESMLFIPLLENAFKHGISLQKKTYITVHLRLKDKRLFFEVKNTLHKDDADIVKPGIGLENLKKRLDLLYPGKHQLLLKREEPFFKATLIIDLL